jgi:hypothetical protein
LNPAQGGLDNSKDDHDDAGHGPADKDAECDTEQGPHEALAGKEAAAAIVVGSTRIEAAISPCDKRKNSSGSEKGSGDGSGDNVFGRDRGDKVRDKVRDRVKDRVKDALKGVHAKDTTNSRVHSREKEVDDDIKHGGRGEVGRSEKKVVIECGML